LDERPATSARSAFERWREGENEMSAKMVLYKDYVAGWLDISIRDFLEALSPNAASTKYVLITCLDSNLDPASLREKSPELTDRCASTVKFS
jgi:hypothetical protein